MDDVSAAVPLEGVFEGTESDSDEAVVVTSVVVPRISYRLHTLNIPAVSKDNVKITNFFFIPFSSLSFIIQIIV